MAADARGVITAALLALWLLLPAAAMAQGRGARELRPFYDSRAGEPAPAPARLKLDGALTAPRGGGRDGIARAYLRAKHFDSSDLTLAKRIDAPGGVTILRYRQEYRGIPAFDGVNVALDRAGRVLGVTGSPPPDPAVDSVTPRLSAAQARRALGRSVGATRATGEEARLTLFGSRLAWRVDLEAGPGEHYDAVVDATDGRLLWRANRVKSASARVFDYYAGAPQGGQTDRLQDLTTPGWLPAGATTLSGPYAHAWSDVDDDDVADTAEEVGRVAGDFQFTFTPFANGPPRCTATHLCSWDPVGDPASWQTNRAHSTTEAFFLVSKFHDHLARAPIGFDEDSGAFQATDPVLTQTLDGPPPARTPTTSTTRT